MAATMNEYEWEALPELEGEYEGEFELEGEFEGEEFLGTLARGIGGLFGGQGEYEGEFELEGEFEGEFELEGEYEAEAFFGRLAAMASRAAPALRRVGLRAARSALGGLGRRAGAAAGGAIAGRSGAQTGQNLGGQLGALLSSLLPQREYEGEFEEESEINPIARIYPDVLMEHLGHAAAQAESEAEAEAFVGALIPVATRLAPVAARAVMRNAPQLIRGMTNVARTLRRNPATRPLVRALPTIARRTVGTIARQAQAGRPVTPRAAVQTLARQTANVIGNPRQCVVAYRRSCALDRRYHRAVSATGAAAPAQPTRAARPRRVPATRRGAAATPVAAGGCPTCGGQMEF